MWTSGKMKTNLVDFPGPKQKTNDTKYIEIQLKVFREDINGEFRKHQQIKLGKSDFKQLLLLRNQIVVATADFAKDEKLQPIVTAPLSNDLDEQLKHVQKAITIVDRSKRKIIATMKNKNLKVPMCTFDCSQEKLKPKNFSKSFLLITSLMNFCFCSMLLIMYLNKLYLTRVFVTLCN